MSPVQTYPLKELFWASVNEKPSVCRFTKRSKIYATTLSSCYTKQEKEERKYRVAIIRHESIIIKNLRLGSKY